MNDYSSLDLPKVKSIVADLAYIDEAKEYIRNEEIIFNPLFIRNSIKESADALDILKRDISISFDGIYNCNHIFEKAHKGIILSGQELNSVLTFHNHCSRVRHFFYRFDLDLSLRDYSDSIKVIDSCFDEISNAIDNGGYVKEDASPNLKDINRKLNNLDRQIADRIRMFIAKHESSLQEQTYFVRDDRITFLIKNSDKYKYSGYVHGTSASNLASYVEPGQFVELNNEKIALLDAQEEEIKRILKRLSVNVGSVYDVYAKNFESLVKLDVVFAKAKYGFDNLGVLGSLSDRKEMHIKGVCHPLLDKKSVVSNSYNLAAPYQGIVISGSNTGGKTVSLKVIGLSVLMTYLGIPVTCESCEVPLYDNVFVDIDDNQSIEDSLSTFSAHITNVNNILSVSTDHSLVLIDELISGTDPKEAQAISIAVIEKIESIGADFVITTHYDDIKNYSIKDDRILLSSVGFDMNTLKPTYRYIEDSIGSSNALEIASRYLDDPFVINRARNIIEENRTKEDELMKKLEFEIDECGILKEKLVKQENENENLKKEYSEKIAEFEKEKETLRKQYIKELNEYIDSVKEQAFDKLESINSADEKVIEKIEELKADTPEPVKKKDDKFEVGDNVRVGENEQIGVIESINGNKATVNVRGLKINTNLNKLTKMPKTSKQKNTYTKNRVKRASKEINLIGMRVEEALPLMEVYIDNAFASQMSSAKIIHGIGTGALRKAIRDKLSRMSFVKEIKNGDYYDGGSAVTIVEFKR